MRHSPKYFDEIAFLFSASCPFGKLFVPQNVRPAKCPFANVRSAKRPFGKMSIRQNSFGKMSFGKMSFGKVSFGKMSGYQIFVLKVRNAKLINHFLITLNMFGRIITY
jgi:hypothetical protein